MSGTDILVVEDDIKMQQLLASQLSLRDYTVRIASTGLEALGAVRDQVPDIILLDISLPEMDGLEVCRQLREWTTVPIILVTASDMPHTKVTALEIGGDDYLTKPFHMGELIARIRAVLRRVSNKDPISPGAVCWDDITLDMATREVKRSGDILHLTKIEYDLLREFVTHPDKALTYNYLLSAVWGHGYEDVRPVHVHICNLRRKLEPGPTGPRRILALPGIGYRFRSANN